MRTLLLLSLLAALSSACRSDRLDGDGVFFLSESSRERPRLRFRDGQVSLNDSCVIRIENGLNTKIPPLYVNGSPLGFC